METEDLRNFAKRLHGSSWQDQELVGYLPIELSSIL